jgi:hypothetical protein
MFDLFLIPIITATVFGTSAYFITQSKECPCKEVNPTAQSYILGFSYVGIAYAVLSFILGTSILKFLLHYPLLGILPVLYAIGLIAWAILTIRYSYTLKACQCPETVAGKITFGAAIAELIVAGLAILLVGFEGTKIAMMSAKDRKQLLSLAKYILSSPK